MINNSQVIKLLHQYIRGEIDELEFLYELKDLIRDTYDADFTDWLEE